MSNINIQDSVYQAIEEYNNTVKRPHCQKFTDEERRGLFYTVLRRHLAVISQKRQWGRGMSVDDLNCTFKENGELKTFKITRTFDTNHWEYHDGDKSNLRAIKEIGNEHKEFFRTPIMNEIADIVNQIK